MSPCETFCTAGIDRRHKLQYWNEVACNSFTPIVSDPEDVRNFDGTITRGTFGELRMGVARSAAQRVRHLRAHVAQTREARFFLQIQTEGESINRQDGREARISSGGFTLCDTTRPYEMQFQGDNAMLVVGIPHTLLRRYIAFPERVVAISMSGQAGPSGLLSHFLCNLWSRGWQELDAAAAERITRVILELLSAAYAETLSATAHQSSIATAHRMRIISWIEEHLADPDLTPAQVAAACRMTPRYMHRIFSQESETVARYILRRRLEECARSLRQPQPTHTITAISFAMGFNSATHFGRAFRAHYGMSPREFQRQHQT